MPAVRTYVHEAKPGLVLGYYRRIDTDGPRNPARVERRIHGVWMLDATEGSPSVAGYDAMIASGKLRACLAPPFTVTKAVTLVPHAIIDQGVSKGLRDAFAWRRFLASPATLTRVSLVVSQTPDGTGYCSVESSRWFGESTACAHSVSVTTTKSASTSEGLYNAAVRERSVDLGGVFAIHHTSLELATETAIERTLDLGYIAEACAKHAGAEVEKREREEREARAAEKERLRKEREEREARERAERERAERARIEREKAEAERALRIARGDTSELSDEELREKIRARRRKAAS